jgi:single stranded DNA-binding protein
MSDGVNQVFLVGQLGANPELRYAGDQPVCEFRVATTESWKNGSGERQEHTEWHRVVVWGPSAEACNKVLSKGWSVTVLGNIRTETYEKDGEKKYATTGNALVTHVSHEVMRQTIASKADYAGKALLWLEASSDSKPDGIILIHAPMEVIMKRIQGRQEKGDTSEKFWGFNAPLFLHAYQEAWKRTLSILETHGIPILSMDSSVLSPTRMLHLFTERYARNTTKE